VASPVMATPTKTSDGARDTRNPAEIVLAKIQGAYMAGMRRCYRLHLTKAPEARGKVTISFTVSETGRAVDGEVKGFAGDVDACITAQIAGWRFPVPKDLDGNPIAASFSVPLQLAPD
jgi:hypothetical protein